MWHIVKSPFHWTGKGGEKKKWQRAREETETH